MIAVTEFISDFHEGYTNAFLCRGEDQHLYVAKSRRSGRESLIREWICGRIGQELGLPIPPIAQLYVDSAVLEFAANEQIGELANEYGFGSRYVTVDRYGPPASLPILNVSDVAEVDPKTRLVVLLFDWWILNFDRSDDNPNLLWDRVNKSLHVIDHNLAFDEGEATDFWKRHIFRGSRKQFVDHETRVQHAEKLAAILSMLVGFWSEIPTSWTDASTLTLHRVDEVLRRCLTDDFWRAI